MEYTTKSLKISIALTFLIIIAYSCVLTNKSIEKSNVNLHWVDQGSKALYVFFKLKGDDRSSDNCLKKILSQITQLFLK